MLQGSVTFRAAATATAASAAFPPNLKIRVPISVARGWLDETAPCSEITGDRREPKGKGQLTDGSAMVLTRKWTKGYDGEFIETRRPVTSIQPRRLEERRWERRNARNVQNTKIAREKRAKFSIAFHCQTCDVLVAFVVMVV